MVKLTSQQILKYQELLRRHCGEEVSYEEAERRGVNFIILLKTLEEYKNDYHTKQLPVGPYIVSRKKVRKVKNLGL